MKLLVIADVGGVDGYHVGDEAMLDRALENLRRRGPVEVTVVSGDPADTRRRHGVRAIGGIGFAAARHAHDLRERRLAAALALADEAGPAAGGVGDAAAATAIRELIAAVAGSDGVLVAGGGNLSASWPQHLYERVAVLLIARRLGVPAVVSGQTLGPELESRQARLLGRALAGSALVGLRERSSYDLAAALLADARADPEPDLRPGSGSGWDSGSATLRLQLDDAVFLAEDAPEPLVDGDALAGGYVALTVNPLGEGPDAQALLAAFADLIVAVTEDSGLPVLFLPHVGRWGGAPEGDVAVGQALGERVAGRAALMVAPLLDARRTAALTRRASVVISTRYHPLVFASAAAVPCLALYQDRYTAVKLRGALDHAGLGAWSLPLDAIRGGLGLEAFSELWRRRAAVSAHLRELTGGWRTLDRAHWDEVWAALTAGAAPAGGSPPVAASPPATRGLATPSPELGSWTHVNDLADLWMARLATLEGHAQAALGVAQEREAELRALQASLETTREAVDDLHRRYAELDLLRATTEAEKIQLAEETCLAEAAAQAARDRLAGERRQLLEERADRDEEQRMLTDARAALAQERNRRLDAEAQFDALLATKTLRWTEGPRRAYGRLRRRLRR